MNGIASDQLLRLLPRLLAAVRVLPDNLDVATAIPLEVPQHIAHVSLDRLDLRGQLLRHEEPERDHIVQVAQDRLGPIGYRVALLGRQIEPARDVAAEQIRCHRDRHDHQRTEPQVAVQPTAMAQPIAEQLPVGEGEEGRAQRDEVDDIAEIDDTARHVEEVRHDSQMADRARQPRRQPDLGHFGARYDQHEHHSDADDERRDLVASQRRGEEADRRHAGDQQQAAGVLGHDDAEIRHAAQRQQERDQQGAGERYIYKEQVSQILAQQVMVLVNRVAQRDLERAVPFLFRQRSHRHGGDEEEQHPRQQIEHRAQRRLADEEGRAEIEEEIDRQEHDQQDVGGRVIEVAA
jgi:hypothetical protein